MATAYPGGLRKRGGLLDTEDTIKPTPRNPFLGGVADLLGQAYKLPEMPRMGVPGLDFVAANRNRLMDLLGVGDVQKTAEAMAYGNRLGTGAGMTYQPLPETMGAAMAVAPFAGKAIRATEGLPVGASIKPLGTMDAAVYQGSHKAPNAAVYGGTLDDLSKIMPADVYSSQGIRLYGLNDPKVDAEWFKAAYQAKNNPDKLVDVYRAVPKGIKNINSGDWVTTSPTYAKMHGENTLGGDYEILSSKVPAKTLSSEGYPYEFGYNAPTPEELKRLQAGGLLAP